MTYSNRECVHVFCVKPIKIWLLKVYNNLVKSKTD
jgi:hypothetical protein